MPERRLCFFAWKDALKWSQMTTEPFAELVTQRSGIGDTTDRMVSFS